MGSWRLLIFLRNRWKGDRWYGDGHLIVHHLSLGHDERDGERDGDGIYNNDERVSVGNVQFLVSLR